MQAKPTPELCPGPSFIQCCTPRYANTCDPNVDPQPNLGLTSTPGDGGCFSPGMVRVTTFCIDQYEGSILEVLDLTGANAGCVGADGVFDLMGNLHEWTADPNGTFRGGFYVDTSINGNGCLYATTAHPVTHWDYSTGFRCCAD